MPMLALLLNALCILPAVFSHGYLNGPVSRNALADINNGYCSWSGGPVTCSGDAQSWNSNHATGCGGAGTIGNGPLSYATTGIKTATYSAGQVVPMQVRVTANHGGRFDFRLQDVGAQSDPNGALWASAPLLTVESFSPPCNNPAYCGDEPCIATKTCAQIPMSPYGIHNGMYTINVKIPDDIKCEHCVLQWTYNTANSCGGTKVSCDSSEKFWNCADIEITESSGIVSPVPTATFTDAPIMAPSGGAPGSCEAASSLVSDYWCQSSVTDPAFAFIKNSEIYTQLCSCTGSTTSASPSISSVAFPTATPIVDPTAEPSVEPTDVPQATAVPSSMPCSGPFPAHPLCINRINWNHENRPANWFAKRGLDGTRCSIQTYYSLPAQGSVCPPVPASTAPIPAPTLAPIATPTIAPVTTPTIAPTIAPVTTPTVAPTILTPTSELVCRSIVTRPDITDAWCQSVACHIAYSSFCGWVPAGPTPVGPTQAPSISDPTVNPSLAPTRTPLPPLPPGSVEYIGIYDWTWQTTTATPPSGANLGVAFNGWANIDVALSDSLSTSASLTGDKFIAIGGGNANGHLTPAWLTKLNTAIVAGDLIGYQGICYDVEVGDTGMAEDFKASFAIAKANGFAVLVTISHSAPYGHSDKVALMTAFFADDNIDIISPQLYTTGYESANDYVWDGVPWSAYMTSKAKIVPSIVQASYYDDAVDYFSSVARSGASFSISGFIQWKQST